MASVAIERKWCPQCDAYVKAERHGASHLFHLVMSCITVGLWLIVWFFVANGREFHCSTCGSKVKNREPWLFKKGRQ